MQKKFTLLLTACLCSFLSFAQINKGTIVIHSNFGDIRYFHPSGDHIGNKNISYNPGIGYFISRNWEIGTGINYNRVRNRTNPTKEFAQNSDTWGINVYTNYYFGKGKLKPYLTFQAGWENNRGSVYINNVKNDFNRSYFYTQTGGGLNWNISSRFSLFAEATFRNESPFNRYDGHSRLNLTIGARYFFNRSKKN